jgi:hypothetical protein
MNIRELVRLYKLWRRLMNINKWLHGIQWLNVLSVVGQVAAAAGNIFPANPYVLVANAILGAILPSVGGISHKIDGTKVVAASQ